MTEQKLTEMIDPTRPLVNPDQVSHLPVKDTPGCGCAVAIAFCLVFWALVYLTCGS